MDENTKSEAPVPETTKVAQAEENKPDGPNSGPKPNKLLVSWQAPEFVYYEKDTKWFVYGGLATLAVLAIAGFLQQWLMIVVIVMLAAVIYQHARRQPRTLDYEITELGIKAGDRFHPYNELKSFWVIYNPPVETLYVETTRRLMPQIQIQLGGQDPTQIRQALHPRLAEQEKRTEDWLDTFGRLIRF